MYILIIGNKNYSSWSPRLWLALLSTGLVFQEQQLSLFTHEFTQRLGGITPAGRRYYWMATSPSETR